MASDHLKQNFNTNLQKDNPIVVAFIFATFSNVYWIIGVVFGILLAIASRVGNSCPKLRVRNLIKSFLIGCVITGVFVFLSGYYGYKSSSFKIDEKYNEHSRLIAAIYANSTMHVVGIVVMISILLRTIVIRIKHFI